MNKIFNVISVVFFIVVIIGFTLFTLSDIEYIKIVAILCSGALAFYLLFYGGLTFAEWFFGKYFRKQ